MPTYVVEDEEDIYYPICGIFNKTPEKDLAPGLYLGLMHGRRPAHERLSGWGLDGPIIGPLQYVHTTYGCDLHLARADGAELESLEISGGLLEFNGIYYGDWTVFVVEGDRSSAPGSRKARAAGSGQRGSRVMRRTAVSARSRPELRSVDTKLISPGDDDQAAGVDPDEPEEHLDADVPEG